MTSTVDEHVEIYPSAGDMTDTATKLLKAAEDLDLPVESVATVSGGFRVPAEIAEKAGLAPVGADDEPTAYEKMKVDELHEEIAARNEGRDEDTLIPADGKKADLIAALNADDEQHAE